jgi:hypothetical protein
VLLCLCESRHRCHNPSSDCKVIDCIPEEQRA